MTVSTSTEMSWKAEQSFHDQHPEVSFPEDAIAHLYVSLDRIQRQIYLLQEQGVDEGCVESYQKDKRTYYNHVLPAEGGKRVRFYLKRSEVSRKRSEISRGNEVKRLQQVTEQIGGAIASLKESHGNSTQFSMNPHRAGGRVEEGAIAL